MFRYFVENSFKSDVAAEHVCSEVPARNQSQKATRRRLREQERRTAIPAASAAILTFFHGIVPISNKISLLLWRKPVNPDVCLKIPVVFCGDQLERWVSLLVFFHEERTQTKVFDVFIAV